MAVPYLIVDEAVSGTGFMQQQGFFFLYDIKPNLDIKWMYIQIEHFQYSDFTFQPNILGFTDVTQNLKI